jgi:hypothetical protein
MPAKSAAPLPIAPAIEYRQTMAPLRGNSPGAVAFAGRMAVGRFAIALTFKLPFIKWNLVDLAQPGSNNFQYWIIVCDHDSAKKQECPMTHPIRTHPIRTPAIRIVSLAILAAAALQLSLVSVANAQQSRTDPAVRHHRRPTMFQNIGPNGYFPNQAAARAAHPITQGGTTGGTVNPGLTRDHMQHGYNG